MPIKGSVTINYDVEGNHTLEPPLGVLDRNVQTLQWSLVAPANVQFAPTGIVFSTPPNLPPGFSIWPGELPEREDDWQYSAKANHKVPHGEPPQFYKYDIFLDVSGVVTKISVHDPVTFVVIIDPPIENQPQP